MKDVTRWSRQKFRHRHMHPYAESGDFTYVFFFIRETLQECLLQITATLDGLGINHAMY